MTLTTLEQKILNILRENAPAASSRVHTFIVEQGGTLSLITVKRTLSKLRMRGLVDVTGVRRSLTYALSIAGRLCTPVDAAVYNALEPDRRHGQERYNPDLFIGWPESVFSQGELDRLETATKFHDSQTHGLSSAVAKRELERLVVELAWKSSKIEGNTYTLLDTERLLLEHKEAPGHTKDEMQMILNHKYAFAFTRENTAFFLAPTQASIEELHKVLTLGLEVSVGLRARMVGITGSVYRPLDNAHQIREAFTALVEAIARATTPYDKTLLALLGVSYLQPFEDGNKRTARLLANALLLAHGCAPLSYRSVSEDEYRAATLVFYETNSIMPFKKIFIEQYDFAARNYAVKDASSS